MTETSTAERAVWLRVAAGAVLACGLFLLVDVALDPPASVATWTPYVDGALALVALACGVATAAVAGAR